MKIKTTMRKPEATLSLRFFGADGTFIDYGIVSRKCITDDWVNLLVDVMQGLSGDLTTFKYHDWGEGTTAEDETDVALESPCGEAKDTGTQTEGAQANIYKSVATHTFAGTFTITEHGIFNADDVLLDRSTGFSKTVNADDRLEATYEVLFPSGS
jgi:hypothetical protein